MRKKLLTVFLMAVALNVRAESTFHVDDFTVCPGETRQVEVKLLNEKICEGFQLKLTLPEGLSFVKTTEEDYFAKTQRTPERFNLECSLRADGSLNFVGYCDGSASKTIAQGDGAVFVVLVEADEMCAKGQSEGLVSMMEVNLEGEDNVRPADATFTVTVKERVVLDETQALPDGLSAGEDAQVVLRYTALDGWNTIAVPFTLTAETLTAIFGTGWKAYEFDGCANEQSQTVLSFKTATGFKAGHPYLVWVETAAEHGEEGIAIGEVSIGATAPEAVTAGDAVFQGTFAPVAAPDMEGRYGITGAARIARGSDKASISGYRAFFRLTDPAAHILLHFPDDATGIKTLDNFTISQLDNFTISQLDNFTISPLDNFTISQLDNFTISQLDNCYDLSGRKLSNSKIVKLSNCEMVKLSNGKLPKGIYIINGRKVVVR